MMKFCAQKCEKNEKQKKMKFSFVTLGLRLYIRENFENYLSEVNKMHLKLKFH